MNQDLMYYTDQISLVTAGIWDIVRAIKRTLNIPVKIIGVPGNHGRQGGEAPIQNNLDYLIMQNLYMLSWYDLDGVEVDYTMNATYFNVEVKGRKVHLRHVAPPQAETAAARAKYLGWDDIHNFDIFLCAHLHHPSNPTIMCKDIVMNGSPVGMDDYSEGMAKRSRPSQTLFGIDPDIGFSFKYNVYLDKFGDGGEAAELLKKYPMLHSGDKTI